MASRRASLGKRVCSKRSTSRSNWATPIGRAAQCQSSSRNAVIAGRERTRCCSGVRGICVIRASLPRHLARHPLIPRRLLQAMLAQIVEEQERLPSFCLNQVAGCRLGAGEAIGKVLRIERGRDEIRRLPLFYPHHLTPNLDPAGQGVADLTPPAGERPVGKLGAQGTRLAAQLVESIENHHRLVRAGGDCGLQRRKLPQHRGRPIARRTSGQSVQTGDQRLRLLPRVVDLLLDARLRLCRRLRR